MSVIDAEIFYITVGGCLNLVFDPVGGYSLCASSTIFILIIDLQFGYLKLQ